MKVSGSILAVKSDYLEYAKKLKYAKVDFLHIDIFQHSNIFKIEDIQQFDGSYLPLDVHLIFNEISDKDISVLNKAGVKYLNIQYETLTNKQRVGDIGQKFQGNFGIAITSKTPLHIVDQYIDKISQVLVMCSEPGISGAQFDEANFERIAELHRRYPSLELFADGGINNIIAEKMGSLGVSMIVSGSYLCKDIQNLDTQTYNLKYLNEKHINVTRLMIKPNFLPILTENAGFINIIDVMTKFRMGIVLIVEDNILHGVICDGDIRRGIVRYGEETFKRTAIDFINRHPFCVGGDVCMEDIYKQLMTLHRGIDVVPVLEDGKLIGAVDLRIGL